MGGTLTFNRDALVAEIARVKAAPKHKALYGDVTGPGLWLVGDQGVYLMGNDQDRIPDQHPVAYAAETDPSKVEDWWEAKRAIFGGDDGVEFFGMAQIEHWLGLHIRAGDEEPRIKMSARSIEFLPPRKTPARRLIAE